MMMPRRTEGPSERVGAGTCGVDVTKAPMLDPTSPSFSIFIYEGAGGWRVHTEAAVRRAKHS